ncbi:MAG: DNA topoisomerase [Oscillospiraceae bacterium]|nr:DNA topoisomerase [Oscillospiraceae bacterium]
MASLTERIYDNESIKSLKGAERVRKRPGVIFGSDGLEGCEHSFFEILSNAIDEAKAGFGNKIIVTRYKDKSITVQDFGRGIPVDFNKRENKYNWELLFCELYAGGKYNLDQFTNYEFSLGLNGLGLCATQYASEFMDVEIIRDGFKYNLKFEHGENIGGLTKENCTDEQTGSTLHWRPDLDVFTDIDIPYEYFVQTLKRQAVVNSPINLVLIWEAENGTHEETFVYSNGLQDYLVERCSEDYFTPIQYKKSNIGYGKDREDKSEYSVKAEVAFCFSNSSNFLEYYHNSSFLEHGGASEKAVKSAFVSQIDNFLKKNNKYLKNESKITFADIEDSLALVISSQSSQTSYENQTKKSITNKFITEFINEFLQHELEIYFIEKPDEANKIADQILVNKRSRENAERTRINIKKKLQGNLDIANRVKKFVDCRTKDVQKRELYIVEGDSALGACKLSRDAEYQAIIPVRGKILNCLKSEYNKIFNSEIIIDIVKVLGCGVEAKTASNKQMANFNINQLRYNKIVICTDADVDGFQIRTLILTMFFRLMPELIKQGYVYIAQSPLYEINTKEKTYFAYSEKEKLRICNELNGKKYTIQRSKGLGENEPDMMWLTTMNPKTRRLVRVNFDQEELVLKMFDVLLGEDIVSRKEFIAQNGAKYMDLLDVM